MLLFTVFILVLLSLHYCSWDQPGELLALCAVVGHRQKKITRLLFISKFGTSDCGPCLREADQTLVFVLTGVRGRSGQERHTSLIAGVIPKL